MTAAIAAARALIAMGREWLANAPGPGQTAPGLAVWEGPVEGCALCTGTGSGAMPPEGERA